LGVFAGEKIMIEISELLCLMKKYFVAVVLVTLLSGCSDRYQEGYDAGYSDGAITTEKRLKREYEERLAEQKRDSFSYSSTSVETCGGAGVTVNGKHYQGGKTGCVRVYSDGRVRQY
jgi:hypothetical protein